MSIYNKDRVRELANEQLKKDLNFNEENHTETEYEMTDEQFQKYWFVYQICKHTYAKGIFKDWKFHFTDDVWDFLEENGIEYSDYCDYDIEEYIEEAK